MRDAVIVSTARTGLAKSFRGGLTIPRPRPWAAMSCEPRLSVRVLTRPRWMIVFSVRRPSRVPRLTTWVASARLPAVCPIRWQGWRSRRQCSSGLMSIATAAKSIMCNEYDIAVAGGVESISLVQTKHKNAYRSVSEAVSAIDPTAYMPMLETAEVVSARYGISREAQDEYSLQSQQRTARLPGGGLVRRRNRADGRHSGGV